MSKLDEIYLGVSGHDIGVSKFKREVKALMRELVGEDYVTTSYGASRELMHVANGEKAKLRKKIEEL